MESFLLYVAISFGILMLIAWLIDLHTKKQLKDDIGKSMRLAAMAEDLEKNGDMDKFYKDFEELFYPNGYFEL